MDEDLISEIIAAEGLTPEQAAYVAAAQAGELVAVAERWDAAVWADWREVLKDNAFVIGWDLAARLAGNPAA